MRYRRSSNRNEDNIGKELEKLSLKGFLNEFVKNYTQKTEDTNESAIKLPPGFNLTSFKTELVKHFTNRIKLQYHQSNLKQKEKDFHAEISEYSSKVTEIIIRNLVQLESTAIRLHSLHLALYLSHYKDYHDRFQKYNINIYVVRIIDLNITNDETSLAVEYIRLLSQLYPSSIDKSYFYCLLSAIENTSNKLNTFILETLLEITCKFPKLACECDVFTDLFNYMLNTCSNNEICIELIMQCLLKVIDDSENIKLFRLNDLFRILIAPIVDFEYVPLNYGHSDDSQVTKHTESKIENVLNVCQVALNIIFNSYIGVMCFCSDGDNLLRNLLAPLTWFLQNGQHKNLDKIFINTEQPSSLNSTTTARSSFLNNPNDLITYKKLLIAKTVLNFIYKLFRINDVDQSEILNCKNENSSNLHVECNLDDEFINTECSKLLDSSEDNLTSQSNITNLVEELKLKMYSTSTNLTLCYKVYLIKVFIEASLFEALADLYFGLPVTFLQAHNPNYNHIYHHYQFVSFKCINLFAELFYLANDLLFTEFLIEEFSNDKLYNSNRSGIYGEMKKMALVSYLKNLNDLEREKEFISYLSEFSTKKDNAKNGTMIPTNKLAKLSYYSHKFLINSGYFMHKKYEFEYELLNNRYVVESWQNLRIRNEISQSSSFINLVSMLNPVSGSPNEQVLINNMQKREILDLERKLDECIEQTLVLIIDSNLSNADSQQNKWNWSAILKLFESFLITSNNHPRFLPTHDAMYILANRDKFIEENQKLIKLIKNLFIFFEVNQGQNDGITSPRTFSFTNSYSSTTHTTHFNDLILCSGCYLIDFVLEKYPCTFQTNLDPHLSPYQNQLIHFLQMIKQYLLTEFPINNTHGMMPNYNKFINKDSPISYYILFMGHLSSSEAGNKLMESFKLYDILMDIIAVYRVIPLMKLIVTTFNYYTSIRSRHILKVCLSLSYDYLETSEQKEEYSEFKIYALKLIYNIFRANTLKFDVFFLDILFMSLFRQEDSPQEIIRNSLADSQSPLYSVKIHVSNMLVLELSLNLIEYFVNLRPDLIDTLIQTYNFNIQHFERVKSEVLDPKIWKNLPGTKMIRLKMRLLFYRFELSYSSINHSRSSGVLAVENLIDEWDKNKMDKKYFQLIERYLFDSNAINPYFTNEISKDDDYDLDDAKDDDNNRNKNSVFKLYRRINDSNKNYNLFSSSIIEKCLPFHISTPIIHIFHINNLHSEKFDCKVLKHLEIIKSAAENCNRNKVKQVKIAFWSVSLILSSESGFKYISYLFNKLKTFNNIFDLICNLIKITEESKFLSIRATGFVCLNIVSKSCTGAGLLGKLGWHTFQPNRETPAKSFYSIVNSIDNEHQKETLYSSIELAISLYNLNRAKSKIKLKEIKPYFYCELSTHERDFLAEKQQLDLVNISDQCFLKVYDLNKVGFFFDNICVPIRAGLIAVDPNPLDNKYFLSSDSLSPYKEGGCVFENCLHCCLQKEKNQDNTNKIQSNNNTIRIDIVNSIDQLIPMINLDKKLPHLTKLKYLYSSEFNMCLFNLISNQFLSCHKIRFNLRKFVQELFFDNILI